MWKSVRYVRKSPVMIEAYVLTLKASASLAVSSRCESISSENGDEKPNLLRSQRGKSEVHSGVAVIAWQEVGDEGDWAANAAIKLAERVDALATNRERAGRVNKRSINAQQQHSLWRSHNIVPAVAGRRKRLENDDGGAPRLPATGEGCLPCFDSTYWALSVVDCSLSVAW